MTYGRLHRSLLAAAPGAAAAIVVAGAISLAGCNECTSSWFTASSSAALTGVESAAAVASWYGQDGGDASAVAIEVTTVSTHPFETCDGSPCVDVTGNSSPVEIRIRFDLPSGVGSFQLADLHAVACDLSCTPLAGSLVVTSFTAPCKDLSCGRFDASLTITEARGDGGPTLSGTSSLSFEQGQGKYSCGSPLGGG